MAAGYSRGRGRGRGWAQNDQGPLPRPGPVSDPVDVECTNLINIVEQVKSADLEAKAVEFINDVDKKDEETIRNITDQLYEQGIRNRDFGMKLIMLYSFPAFKENSNGSIMRKQLINNFQADYERRIDLRHNCVRSFHNVICLFSQYLSQSTGNLEALHLALLKFLEMLLESGSVQDIKIFTERIIMHGPHLCANMMKKLIDVMVTARQTFLRDNLTLEQRQMLMYAIDLVNYNCKPFPRDLEIFHEVQLGRHFIISNQINNGK